MVFYILLGAFALSFGVNVAQGFLLAMKRRKKDPVLTTGAEDLLHDLTRGPAILRVEVIDAANLLLRSPRT